MNLIVITIGLVPFQINSVACIKFQSRLDRNSCAVPTLLQLISSGQRTFNDIIVQTKVNDTI